MKSVLFVAACILLSVSAPGVVAVEVEGGATGQADLYCTGILGPWCAAFNATCDYIFSQTACAYLR